MEVELTPEQASRLEQLAHDRATKPGALAQEAIVRYLEEEARFVNAVERGEAQLAQGQYLTHDEVKTRIEQLLNR